MRRGWTIVLLFGLAILAAGSLARGARHALHPLHGSADLMKRAEEVTLFLSRADPYDDPDMTYPPSAPPVFTVLVGPFVDSTLRAVWLVANVAALVALGLLIPKLAEDDWPGWLRWAFLLVTLAGRPGRLGIGLGQFHAIPLLLMILCALLAPRDRWGRQVLAGLCLGIALIKPTLALPLLVYLAVRRAWIAIGMAAITQTIFCLVTSLFLRIDPIVLFREWVARAKGQEAAGLIDVPSLSANLLHLSGAMPTLLGLVALVAGSLLIVSLRRRSAFALVSLACGTAAIFTYHRPYDLVLLYVAFAYCVDSSIRGRLPWALTALFTTLFILPTDPFPPAVQTVLDGGFVAGSYAMLGICVYLTIREPSLVTPLRPSRA